MTSESVHDVTDVIRSAARTLHDADIDTPEHDAKLCSPRRAAATCAT